MGRSLIAVIVGYMAMMVFAVALTFLAIKAFDVKHPTTGYLVYNVVATLLAALLGGFVCGSIAAERKMRHGIVLAMVMVVMAAFAYAQRHSTQPLWYQSLLIVLPPCMAVGGAWRAEWRDAQAA